MSDLLDDTSFSVSDGVMFSHSFAILVVSVESGLVEQADNIIKARKRPTEVINFRMQNNTTFLNFKASGQRVEILAFQLWSAPAGIRTPNLLIRSWPVNLSF